MFNSEKIIGIYQKYINILLVSTKMTDTIERPHLQQFVLRNQVMFVTSSNIIYVYNADNSVLTNLNKIYARPYEPYASVIYSPHYLQLVDIIENVLRNFVANKSFA